MTYEEGFAGALIRARDGDEKAFAALYRDVQPRLLRYLDVKVPGYGDDVSSETWLEVVRGLKKFEGDEMGFRAWVFTIARRKIVDRARYNKRRPTVPLEEAGELTRGYAPDVAEAHEDAEETRAALALVATLPPDQAEVILLRVVWGFTNAQIASALDKTPGAVRVLAHRGLRRLAELVAQTMTSEGRLPRERVR